MVLCTVLCRFYALAQLWHAHHFPAAFVQDFTVFEVTLTVSLALVNSECCPVGFRISRHLWRLCSDMRIRISLLDQKTISCTVGTHVLHYNVCLLLKNGHWYLNQCCKHVHIGWITMTKIIPLAGMMNLVMSKVQNKLRRQVDEGLKEEMYWTSSSLCGETWHVSMCNIMNGLHAWHKRIHK